MERIGRAAIAIQHTIGRVMRCHLRHYDHTEVRKDYAMQTTNVDQIELNVEEVEEVIAPGLPLI